MYYKTSDIHQILRDTEEKYIADKVYYVNDDLSINDNVEKLRIQLIRESVVLDVLKYINQRLDQIIDVPSSEDFCLDIPSQCDDCFALRTNGICGTCAFTGDLSESGFYSRFGIMENCPFLTPRKIDELTYDFIRENFDSVYQQEVLDMDMDFRTKIHESLQKIFWREDND